MSRQFAAAWASAALLVSLGCGPAAAVEAVAGTQLVMHIGPGAEHRSVATVPAEAHLTVLGCIEAEAWCLARFGGRHGWVDGESLGVVGFSRPPPRQAVPAAPQVVVVPVPVALAVPRRFATAEDVVIGVGEHVGRAAFVPRPGRKAVDLRKRHRATAAFKRHELKRDVRLRRLHGDFKHVQLHRPGFHPGRQMRFDRLHFGKPGARLKKELRFERSHFGKHGAFIHRGKSIDHGLRFTKTKHRFGKQGRSVAHTGKARFTGLRVKGGWRP